MQTDASHARSDRPATDENDLSTVLSQPDDLLGDRRHAIVVQTAVVVREHTCAHFDDDCTGRCGDFLADRVEHGKERRRTGDQGSIWEPLRDWFRIVSILITQELDVDAWRDLEWALGC